MTPMAPRQMARGASLRIAVAALMGLAMAACGGDGEAAVKDGVSDASTPDDASDAAPPEDLATPEVASPEPGPDAAADVSAPPGPPVCPPATEDGLLLVRPGCVREVRLALEPDDWERLRYETRSLADILLGDCLSAPPADIFTWQAARLTLDGVEVGPVGVRKKGFLGSLSSEKPSLRVALDKFGGQAEVEGRDRLVFNNMRQDPGLINTCLAYDLLREGGIPAPRCAFARVTVNGQHLGLYAQVEAIDEGFLATHFRFTSGNLYEATLSDFRPEFRGTWGKKTNEIRDDWSDLERAITRLEAPDELLLAEAAKSFDLPSFYRHWAGEILVGHWDGYAGNLNNTWIYEDPATQTFHFIPWGMDAVFGPDPNGEMSPPGAPGLYASGHLARRLYGLPDGRAALRAALEALMASTFDEATLLARVDGLEALLLPHLPVGPDRDTFRAALNVKRAFIANRRRALATLLEAPPPVDVPPREPHCWTEVGAVTADFDTRWGTSGWNPLGTRGSLRFTLGDTVFEPGNVTANARADTNADRPGRGVVELLGQGPGTTVFAAAVGFPEMSVSPGVRIPIDWVAAEGYLGRFDTATESFELEGFLLGGELLFEDGYPIPGEAVRGSFEAPISR
jgi:hypothetical protein